MTEFVAKTGKKAWKKARLDDCCDVVGGSTPSTSVDEYWDGEICWATPKDLSDLEGAQISNTPRKLTQAGLDACAASILPVGSVLFSSRAPIGHVAVNTVPMATNQGFKSLVPKPQHVEAKFLYWWLRTNRSYLEGLGNGATFKEVSKAIVSRIEILLPPLTEQRRIAEVLDWAEALRAKRRAALAQLDTVIQAYFLDLFGDPVTNPKGWRVLRLQDTLSIPLRNGLSPSHAGKIVAKVLTLSAITGGEFDAAAWKMSTFQSPPPPDQAVDEDDFLICRGNGNVRLVGKGYFPWRRMPDVTFPDTMIAARVTSKRIERAFLQHVWNSVAVRRQIESLARTTNGTFKVNQTMLEGITFVVPPLSLQREFAHRIAGVEKLKTAYRASLAEMDALFASLQHRAFRGEL
jgi:type I restriction enzyme S subunit